MKTIICRTIKSALPLALLPFLSLGLSAQANRQERFVNSNQPLQADLLVSLDTARVIAGMPVFLTARAEWREDRCHVSLGGTVTGHIVAVEPHSKQNKGSSFTVLFDTVACDGHPSHVPFNLFAVIVDAVREEDVALADYGAFGAVSTKPHYGAGSTSATAQTDGQNQRIAVRSTSTTLLHLPTVIQSGQVFGQKNLLLSVGDGPEGGSVLSSPKGNFRMEVGTQLVLMPKLLPPSETLKTTAPKASVPSSDTPIPASRNTMRADVTIEKEPDMTEICSSSCTVASLTDSSGGNTSAISTLSSVSLGYVPRESGQHIGFNHEATLVYIDSANLLFAFDSHKLGRRLQSGFRTQSMKTVRAVLLNPATHQVRRIVEWEVPSKGQYVWSVGNGSILVHLGQKLCLLDSDLHILRELSLSGELTSVSVSPSGSRIAVGIIHELHTQEVHEYLLLTQKVQPEEDVDLQLLDDKFTLLSSSHQSSHLPPIVLLDGGEVRTLPLGHHRWRVNEYLWNDRPRKLLEFRSDCSPNLSSALPSDLFIVGCDSSPLQNWYRMVRADGTPVLVSHGSSRELDQASQALNKQEFAVRVVQAEGTQRYEDPFFRSDLRSQQVAVYRSSDGKRLFEATAAPTLVEQSFALSPSGDQLAILAKKEICFYTIPGSPR